jgi:hypothetical protein
VKTSHKLALFLCLPIFGALASVGQGCSSSAPEAFDGAIGDSSIDYTFPNSCTSASSLNICSMTPCATNYTNVQDLGCGSSPAYCCAPNGDSSFGSDGNIDVGHIPDMGVPMEAAHDGASEGGHDGGHDAAHDASHDAERDGEHGDTGVKPDAEHDAPHDAPSDHATSADGHD